MVPSELWTALAQVEVGPGEPLERLSECSPGLVDPEPQIAQGEMRTLHAVGLNLGEYGGRAGKGHPIYLPSFCRGVAVTWLSSEGPAGGSELFQVSWGPFIVSCAKTVFLGLAWSAKPILTGV